MANVNGIEVSGTTYDLEDTTARTTASSASSVATQASSDVSTLQTTVNNISDSVDTIADDLQTVEDNIGDLADLETTDKTDLVSAINETLLGGEEIVLATLNSTGTSQPFAEFTSSTLPSSFKSIVLEYSVIGDSGVNHRMEMTRNGRTNMGTIGLGLNATLVSEDGTYTEFVCREIDWSYSANSITVMPCSKITIDSDSVSSSVANQYLVPRRLIAIV